MTDIFPVNDFNGGMADETDAMQPRFCKRMRNLLLDAAGKPYQRNGLKQWGVQIPTQERINGLKIVRDAANTDSTKTYEKYIAAVYSHRKALIGADPFTTFGAGPSSWTEAVAIGSGVSIAQNVSPFTKAKMQASNGQIYCSFQNRDDYGGASHPRPRRLSPASSAHLWYSANLGLPKADALSTSGVPGGANNYIYYGVLVLTYSIGGITYKTFGPPSDPLVVTNSQNPSPGSPNTFNSINPWPTSSTYGNNESWALPNFTGNTTNVFLEYQVYRTRSNDTVPRRLVVNTPIYDSGGVAFIYNDIVPDANLGAPLYTSDGSAPYDAPPPCKLMHIVGDFSYFGGFDINSTYSGPASMNNPKGFKGAIQSSPGVIESAPSANTIASPDHLTAIDNADIYPVFFCRNSAWRVEGTIDSFGSGSPQLRPISEKIGALRQSAVIKTDRGLIFAAEDGVYFTDGFTCNKITDHLNKYYKTWARSQDPAALDDISAAYVPSTKRYFMGTSFTDINPSMTAANALVVGDMRHQTDEGGAATAYLSGELNLTSLGYSFMPYSMEVWRDILFVGDYQGFVQTMLLEPAVAGDVYPSDDRTDIAAATVGTAPVVWDYIGIVIDFGGRELKKWCAMMDATFKFRYSTTQLTAQISYANDDSFISDALNAMAPLKIIQDFAVTNTRKEKTYRRRFKKGGGAQGLRCQTKQIRLMKGYGNLYSSLPNNVRVGAQVNIALGSATLASGAWPADIVGHELRVSTDAYAAAGRFITSQAGAGLTTNGPAFIPSTTAEWEIWGYPKNEAPGIETYSIAYQKYVGMQTMFNPKQTNSNP